MNECWGVAFVVQQGPTTSAIHSEWMMVEEEDEEPQSLLHYKEKYNME